MENSIIMGYLSHAFSTAKKYYSQSLLKRLVEQLLSILERSRQGSLIIGILSTDSNMNLRWRESGFFALAIKPLMLIKKLLLFCWNKIQNQVSSSRLLSAADEIMSNLFNYSIRSYGAFLFAMLAVEFTLWMSLQANALKYILLRVALLSIAALMLFFDIPVAAFFKGSAVYRFVEKGFADSFTDYHPERAKKLAKLPLIMLAGALVGTAAYILPLKLLLLSVASAIAFMLIIWRYELGVYLAAGFAAILPTSGLLLIMGITIFSFICRWTTGRLPRYKATLIDALVLMFFAALCYSTLTSYFIRDSINVLAVHSLMLLFYFVVTRTIDSRYKIYLLSVLLLISASLTALYGIYQYYGGAANTAAWVDIEMFQDIQSRVGSTFSNPNILGEYLIMMIPLGLALLWYRKKLVYKGIFVAMLGIMAVCMLYTYSRGAWMGLIIALAAFCVVRDRRLFALALIALFILPFALPQSVISRFTSIGNLQDTSSSYRMSILLGSLRMAKDFWISGIGLGSQAFKAIYPKYSLAAAYAHHSHNIYLQIILEMGAAGAFVFMLIILVFARAALIYQEKIRKKDAFLSSIILAAGAGIAGYMVQGLVENIWYNYRVLQTFWVVLAIGLCAIRIAKEEQTDV